MRGSAPWRSRSPGYALVPMKSGVNRNRNANRIDMRIKLSILVLLTSIIGVYAQPDQRIAKSPKVTYDWQPGFVSITELTGAIGIGVTDVPYSEYYYGFSTIASYQFTRNIKAGGGLGIQMHNDGNLFPLFVDGRYSFNAQHVVPFVAASGGLALSFEDMLNQTYVFMNPTAGIRWVAARRTGIVFSAGIMMMSGEFTRNSYINFKLGVEIKTK